MKHAVRISPFWRKHIYHAVVVCCALCAPLSYADQKSEEQQRKFEEIKRTIEKLKKDLEKTKSSQSELQTELEKNERTIQELNKKTDSLRSTIDDKQARLNKLNVEQDTLQQKKQNQSGLVKDYVNAAYRLGKQNEIKLIFNQQDPAQVSRMLKYFRAFSESRQEKIREFVSTLHELSEVEYTITQEKAALQNNVAELQEQRKALQSSQKKRQATLNQLEANLDNNNKRLAVLENDRRRLESILNKVYEEIHAQELNIGMSEFAQLKGQLPRPTKGKALNRFGTTRAQGLTWKGIEFQGDLGADIVAIHHGQVVFSDYLKGHGLLIVIDHGAGFMSLYAHAANLYKELGEWVDAGEVIASVGNTGGRREAALYFELRHNGKATNPTSWLKRA